MRKATVRRWGSRAVLLVGLLLLSPSARAEPSRGDELRRLAQACEKRGEWHEACRWYDEALRADRSRQDCREGYQRCLRHFHLQRRHRDPGYRDVLTRLALSQALDVYEEVLQILLTAVHADRNKVDLNLLFRQGIKEVCLALDDASFRRDHLPGLRPELIEAYRNRLEAWNDNKVASRQQAREHVLDAIRTGQRMGLAVRPSFMTVLTLEFACGACNALDEYTLFLTPGHSSDIRAGLRGKSADVGLVIDRPMTDRGLAPEVEITQVLPRSPAEDAGLRVRDRILKIGAEPVEKLPVELIADRLHGEVGTLVEIVILRDGKQPPPIPLVRRPTLPPSSVEHQLCSDARQHDIGYVRIRSFQETTRQDVKEALAHLQTSGARGLILDLRGNPGGLFRSAVQVSELFLPEGVIAYAESRFPEYNRPFKADGVNPFPLPMVVLVDGGTASSAEVVAGALKERPGTAVFGHTTSGKGSIQSLVPLRKSPVGIRITVAQFFSPTRQPYSGRGVVPTTICDTGDDIITAARAHLQKTLP